MHFKGFVCLRMRKLHAEWQIPADAHDWCQTVFSLSKILSKILNDKNIIAIFGVISQNFGPVYMHIGFEIQLIYKVQADYMWEFNYMDKMMLVSGIQIKWATSWQNQQNGCAPSEDSDQPGHPPSMIRVFAVRMEKALALSFPLEHRSFCRFCLVPVQLNSRENLSSGFSTR